MTHVFLLQQRQGVGQQSHPEASGGDLCRHEGEEKLRRFTEAFLSVKLVKLTVLPWKQEKRESSDFIPQYQPMIRCFRKRLRKY